MNTTSINPESQSSNNNLSASFWKKHRKDILAITAIIAGMVVLSITATSKPHDRFQKVEGPGATQSPESR